LSAKSVDEENRFVTLEKAAAIGKEYFHRAATSGVFVEDAGDAFFVSPPIKDREHSERLAILIRKADGDITPYRPDGHRERLARYLEMQRGTEKRLTENR